ncbi:response regulator transcription factor [Ensifer sp. IC3342]|nr:response regulator transcription factor [Ensifer sp. BRP08]MCA1451159.1 response regulator transcription factor [Ensifer sp. IC3342]
MTAQHLIAPGTVPRILLVEDDDEIAAMVIEMLTENGFEAAAVGSAANMDVILRKQSFDLVVLDAMLPGEDGFSICRRLRASSTIPIVMLTALCDEINRIVGIELGADDYITKPFHPRELMARIKGLLRRASYGAERSSQHTAMRFAGWQIDPILRHLANPDGVQVSMTTAEFDILLAFCHNPGRVMTREQLLRLTHAGVAGPVERSIDVHVSRVRQKIEPNVREPTFIKTVRLGGYVFTPKVEAC